MRLLILGGTWFLGRTVAELAVGRGWAVACFNRGRTGRDVPGTQALRGDRLNIADVRRLVSEGPWDAVVDTSVYEPPDAHLMATALRDVVRMYVLVSTVSAYQQWPAAPVNELSPLWPSRSDARESDPDVAAMSVPFAYGTLKAGCEQAIQKVYDRDALIVRPGVVLGPYEYVGRLPVLLRRAALGGRMLAAGDPAQAIQPVDVRDLAAFILDQVSGQVAGVFNVTAPVGHATYGGLLRSCVEAAGAGAELVWADSDWLDARGVKQWTQIPLWRTAPGTWAVDSSKAQAAGLTCRPLGATVADTWAWLQQEAPVPNARLGEHGLPLERERELLTAWTVRGSGRG